MSHLLNKPRVDSSARRRGLQGRPRPWLVLQATIRQIRVDNVPLLAGGVAFFAMLALVPAMVAAVSLYGLVVSPVQVDHQIASLASALPPAARQLVATQLRTITSTSAGGLGLGVGAGIAVALISASSGMRWLLSALTAAYGERETRGLLKLRLLALLMTFGAMLAIGVSFAALIVLPNVFNQLGLSGVARQGANVLRFPALAALMIAGLSVLYRFGPDRGQTKWKLFTWGSIVATVMWLVGSIGLSVYASGATKFQAAGTYGALGAVIVLLLWLFLTSYAVIVGAVVNATVERLSRQV